MSLLDDLAVEEVRVYFASIRYCRSAFSTSLLLSKLDMFLLLHCWVCLYCVDDNDNGVWCPPCGQISDPQISGQGEPVVVCHCLLCYICPWAHLSFWFFLSEFRGRFWDPCSLLVIVKLFNINLKYKLCSILFFERLLAFWVLNFVFQIPVLFQISVSILVLLLLLLLFISSSNNNNNNNNNNSNNNNNNGSVCIFIVRLFVTGSVSDRSFGWLFYQIFWVV